jgi:hypothetical protein
MHTRRNARAIAAALFVVGMLAASAVAALGARAAG